MKELQVGDRVTVRQWDDMEKQWGLDGDGDIKAPVELGSRSADFTQSMAPFCGNSYVITGTDEDGDYLLATGAPRPFGFDPKHFEEDL